MIKEYLFLPKYLTKKNNKRLVMAKKEYEDFKHSTY